jgi:uncharacterized DUF497 family protein
VNELTRDVGYDTAMTVFLDPLARSRFDEDNSDDETRWVTLGEAGNGNLFVVAHTHDERAPDGFDIGITSLRLATMCEASQYREGTEPLHLDPEVLSYLAARAEARGTSLNDLVNELLRKDIELIEAAR